MTLVLTDIILLSLGAGLSALILTLPCAFILALVVRRIGFWGRLCLNSFAYLPLVLPPVLTGYLLLLSLGRRSGIGRLFENLTGTSVAFSWMAVVIAVAVMSFPLVYRSILIALIAHGRETEQAAASLGVGKMTILRKITIPGILPGMVIGASLGFAKSLGEFGATMVFAANIPGETQTISLAIYTLLQGGGPTNTILILSMISVTLSLFALMGTEYLSERYHLV